MTLAEKIALSDKEISEAEVMLKYTHAQVVEWEQKLDLRRELRSTLGIAGVLSKPAGGHVYSQSKVDEGWKPDQKGGVVTAEPDHITKAKDKGEQEPKVGGGDM